MHSLKVSATKIFCFPHLYEAETYYLYSDIKTQKAIIFSSVNDSYSYFGEFFFTKFHPLKLKILSSIRITISFSRRQDVKEALKSF